MLRWQRLFILKGSTVLHDHSITYETPSLVKRNPRQAGDFLLLEAELLDKRIVLALVALLEIAKMSATVSDHLQETATRMKILLVFLEMRRQFLDLAGKDADLDRGRAGV